MSSKHVDISYALTEGIFTVLDNFTYQRVDEITLSGTWTKLRIECNSVPKIATFTTSNEISAANFVTDNYADYLASGVTLTNDGAKLTFKAVPGAAFSSSTTVVNYFDDYYLPSKDEFSELLSVIGYLVQEDTWTSSESSATEAYSYDFLNNVMKTATLKSQALAVWSVRKFTSLTSYTVGGIGPALGTIIYKSGNDYIEVYNNYTTNKAWSNITAIAIGTTGTEIGTGQTNTTDIINQVGHVSSAAKTSDTIVSSTSSSIQVVNANITYPIYKSIPKTPASIYVYIGNVIDVEDGTKDTFSYMGSVQIHVVDNSQMRADLKLCQSIAGVVRGLLKPDKSTLFSISPLNLVVFDPDNSNTLINESEGITKIRIVDIYNFIIN